MTLHKRFFGVIVLCTLLYFPAFSQSSEYTPFIGSFAGPFIFSTDVDWDFLFTTDMPDESFSGSGAESSFNFGVITKDGLYFDGLYGLGWAKVTQTNAFSLSAQLSAGFNVTQKNLLL